MNKSVLLLAIGCWLLKRPFAIICIQNKQSRQIWHSGVWNGRLAQRTEQVDRPEAVHAQKEVL